MFKKLTELKNKIDNGKFPSINMKEGVNLSGLFNEMVSEANDSLDNFRPLEEIFAYIEDAETREAVIEFIKLARVYYNQPLLNFDQACSLYIKEMNIRGSELAESANVIDYYSQDEVISWIAANVFDDEYFGSAVSEEELEYREGLKEEYASEIAFAKVIVANNPNFDAMTYKNKVNFIANILVELHNKRDSEKIKLD